MRDDHDFLEDILTRIDLTHEFVKDGREAFMLSRLIQEAVIRNLEIIGEATRNISEDLRKKYSEVPWRQITAFRNFAIHSYWGVKLERVWQIIDDDLPPLRTQIESILHDLDATDNVSNLPEPE